MPQARETIEQTNRRRAKKRLRNTVDDFLEHLRYVVRQEWTESEENELALARERYNKLTDEVWTLMVEDEHPMSCSCAICVALRVAEDR